MWYDYNSDGIKDVGEPGLDGVSINLTGTDINGLPVNLTTVTAGGGAYVFNASNGLVVASNAAGYTVTVGAGVPAGLVPTFDLDDGVVSPDGSSGAFVLQAGDDLLNVDFGFSATGAITVDKTVVGEASTNSWAFTLISEEAGCVIPVTVTNPTNTADGSGGQVLFSDLPLFSSASENACRYSVTETTQAGWSLTDLQCTPSGVIDINNAIVTGIDVSAAVNCTFENSRDVDVSVDKVLTSTGPYNAGDNVTFTITITNNGPGPATGIVVTDTLTNLTFVSLSGGTCAPASFPCTIPTMASGGSEVLTVEATITAPGAFDNAVTVMPQENDTDLSNNTDNTGNGGGTANVDVSVDKVLATSGPYNVGDTVTYTITIANAGPDIATDIVVTDTLTNLTFVSLSGGACAPASFPCTIPTMVSGGSEVLTVEATITAAGAFDNAVTVMSQENDTDLSNNTDNTGNGGSTTTNVDVSVDKVLATSGPYNVGDMVTYTITIANAGPDTATDIVVTDTLTNLTFVSLSGGTCAPASFPCTIPNIASGGSEVLTVETTITASGTFDNAVTVMPQENDTDLSNNIDNTGNGGGTANVDVSVDKVLATSGPYNMGDTVTYTITIANAGPDTATDIVVTDTLTNLAFVSLSGGTCAPTSFPCTISTMASGGSEVLMVEATITAAGAFDNAVTVMSQENDTDLSNNTDNTGNNGQTQSLEPIQVPALQIWGLLFMMILLAGASYKRRSQEHQ